MHERERADNRKLWDAWTPIHMSGEVYDVQRFRDDPSDVRIDPWERQEVGDVTGKTLLHLQCHFGLDTLSWGRLGVSHVTGVDFSEPAIAFARELAAETGLAERSRFVASDIYDLPGELEGETFDVVYTGGGALCWLPDLRPWAELVRGFLRPGGTFYISEVHPIMWAIADEQQTPNDIRFGVDYWGRSGTVTCSVEGSYADLTAEVDAEVEHSWHHSLGEIVTLLAEQGLRIEFLHEQDVVGYPVLFLTELGDGKWGFPPGHVERFPLSYTLKATKPS